jgi:hypothetical protein
LARGVPIFYHTTKQSGFPIILSALSRRKQIPSLAIPPGETAAPDIDAIIRNIEKLSDKPNTTNEGVLRELFVTSDRMNQQVRLICFLRQQEASSSGWWSLCAEFPEQYVTRLNKLIYVDWYAARFVASPDHAAMWGNYGDGHRGCCLKFRVPKDGSGRPCLPLRRIIGSSGHQAAQRGSNP